MRKALAVILPVTAVFLYVRWDHVKEPMTSLKDRILVTLGFAEEDPPVGFYILTERTVVKTEGGVRAVPSGTEVRLISQQKSTAVVDDGISSFEVLVAHLSRNHRLRTGPRYQSKGLITLDKSSQKKSNSDPSETDDQKSKLAAQIRLIDNKLLELAASLREASKFDLQKGRIEKGEETARELHKQIAAFESERDRLKKEMHLLP